MHFCAEVQNTSHSPVRTRVLLQAENSAEEWKMRWVCWRASLHFSIVSLNSDQLLGCGVGSSFGCCIVPVAPGSRKV